MLISITVFMLLVLPVFLFFISVFSTQYMINEAKEVLEIASLATYTKLNQDRLGTGVIEMNEVSAEMIFYQQIDSLTSEKSPFVELVDPNVSIILSDGKIIINSEISLLSAFKHFLHIRTSLEFIIDPLMEGIQ